MEEELLKFGLTRIEAKVYVTLLKIGSTSSGLLIKKTELHRATVYDALKRLMEKGLVNYIIKGKTRYFEAADPPYFQNIITHKQSELNKLKVKTKKIVKDLEEIKKFAKKKQEAHIYYGIGGAKTVLEDVLKYKSYDTFSSRGGRLGEIMGPFYNFFQKRKKELSIKHRMIVNESLRGTKYINTVYAKKRFLPEKTISPYTTTFIYGEKVAIFIWLEQPIIFVIESKELAESYRLYFEFLWEIAKK